MWDTDETVRIVGISGSLRSASFSTGLQKILARGAAPATEIEVATLEGIPPYNEDPDQEPEIAAVAKFKRTIAERVVLIATPEYNHGILGVLKNALNWASRPVFPFLDQEQAGFDYQFVKGFRGWSSRAIPTAGDVDFHACAPRDGARSCRQRRSLQLCSKFHRDENGLNFMMESLGKLRAEIPARWPVAA